MEKPDVNIVVCVHAHVREHGGDYAVGRGSDGLRFQELFSALLMGPTETYRHLDD